MMHSPSGTEAVAQLGSDSFSGHVLEDAPDAHTHLIRSAQPVEYISSSELQ
jgi:hypothetical protein